MDLTPPEAELWELFKHDIRPTVWQEAKIHSPERFAPQVKWENPKAVHYTYVTLKLEAGHLGRVWAWFERHFDNQEARAQTVLVVTMDHYAAQQLETTEPRAVTALRYAPESWGIFPEFWRPYLTAK